MAFTAKKTDNSIAAVVNDYEAAIVGGLQLLGYGYVNYSEEIANNFVRVAENFSNTTPPANPLKGQLWWNTSGSNQSLWVCRDPTAAASPVTSRWSMIFQVDAASGNVDAWTLRTYAPSQSNIANTVVVRGSDGKIDSGSLPAVSGGVTDLDGLSDVVISSPAATQVLQHNGTNWVNSPMTMSEISDVNTTGAINGSILKYNGTNWVIGTDVAGSGGGAASWGTITGTVTDQTDIINFINAKNWPISSVTGLSADLATRLTLTSLKAQDGSGSGIDADLLDGQHGAYYLNRDNHTGTFDAVSASSYAQNGYVKIGTFVMQWGRTLVSSGTDSSTVTFPIAFPAACYTVSVTLDSDPEAGGEDESDEDFWAQTPTTTGFNMRADGDRSSTYVYWVAIGH